VIRYPRDDVTSDRINEFYSDMNLCLCRFVLARAIFIACRSISPVQDTRSAEVSIREGTQQSAIVRRVDATTRIRLWLRDITALRRIRLHSPCAIPSTIAYAIFLATLLRQDDLSSAGHGRLRSSENSLSRTTRSRPDWSIVQIDRLTSGIIITSLFRGGG